MARIAIAGFLHETDTFAPIEATWDDFVRAEGFPGLTQGPAMLEVFPPINIGTGGFIGEARALGHELAPIAWSAAVPFSTVTEDAYERMSAIELLGVMCGRPLRVKGWELDGGKVGCGHVSGLFARDLPAGPDAICAAGSHQVCALRCA